MAQLLVGGGKPFVMTYHSDIVRQKILGTAYTPLLRLVLQRAALSEVSEVKDEQNSHHTNPTNKHVSLLMQH